MKILEDDVLEFVVAVWKNDRTAYDYGEPRHIDGKMPKKGQRWATPREMAHNFMLKYKIKVRED